MKAAWDSTGTTSAAIRDDLHAWLQATDSIAWADCYFFLAPFGPTFGLTVLAYTSAEVDLRWQSITYKALATRPSRGTSRVTIGTEADTLEVELAPVLADGTLDLWPGTTLAMTQAARNGLLDGAQFTLWRVFLDAPPTWGVTPSIRGGIKLFAGQVGQVDVAQLRIALEVRSALAALDVQLPRNLYQPGCLNSLFDGVCGLSKTGSAAGKAFYFDSTVVGASSSTMRLVLAAAPSQGAGYFDLGYAQINAGPFIYLRRGIKRQVGATVDLIEPWPFALDDGTAIRLQAGCNKTRATCQEKFANDARFRGFPYIPVPDAAA